LATSTTSAFANSCIKKTFIPTLHPTITQIVQPIDSEITAVTICNMKALSKNKKIAGRTANPTKIRMVVDFPAPFGPIKPATVPRSNEK
jgi:hypothetical protein